MTIYSYNTTFKSYEISRKIADIKKTPTSFDQNYTHVINPSCVGHHRYIRGTSSTSQIPISGLSTILYLTTRKYTVRRCRVLHKRRTKKLTLHRMNIINITYIKPWYPRIDCTKEDKLLFLKKLLSLRFFQVSYCYLLYMEIGKCKVDLPKVLQLLRKVS